jgi:hypothetical protein
MIIRSATRCACPSAPGALGHATRRIGLRPRNKTGGFSPSTSRLSVHRGLGALRSSFERRSVDSVRPWLFVVLAAGVAGAGAGCGSSTNSLLGRSRQRDAGSSGGQFDAGTGGALSDGGRTGSGGTSGACRDSRDCVGRPNNELICDRTAGRCVECAASTDCDSGLACYGNHCRPPCTSDRQCTPIGLLCDRTAGLCAECLGDVDCDGLRCVAGVCRSSALGAGGAPAGGAGGVIGDGGVPNTGGFVNGGAGGTPDTGGTANTGGAPTTDAGNGCAPGQKSCGGLCVFPTPAVGCGLPSCNACPGPAPVNGALICNGGACDFMCLSGYVRSGEACVPSTGTGGVAGTGGAGGSNGSGGAGGRGGANTGGGGGCNPSACTGCIPIYYTPCCTTTGTCGCRSILTGTTCI